MLPVINLRNLGIGVVTHMGEDSRTRARKRISGEPQEVGDGRTAGAHFGLAVRLASKSFEAAANADLWPELLRSFAKATGSEGTLIWLHDTADSSAQLRATDASFACDFNFGPGCLASYAAYYTYTNVWLEGIGSLHEGALANSSTWYWESALHKSEFYTDWLRPQGSASRSDRPETWNRR